MKIAAIGFAAGAWWLQRQAALPGVAMSVSLAVLGLGIFLVAGWYRHRVDDNVTATSVRQQWTIGGVAAVFTLGLAFAGGFGWTSLRGHWALDDALATEREGRDIAVTGVIASLPQPFDRGQRFDFDVEGAGPDAAGIPTRVSLAWYNGLSPEEFQEVQPVRAGERWRFTVRLRRPHGSANAHGFDYEAWLLERGIRATGFVRSGRGAAAPQRLDEGVARPRYLVERLRERLRERFWDALPDERYAGILIALAIGDQRAIEPAEWQVFSRTGISHLMSISGLHVTMISGLFGWLVFSLWRRSPRLALRWPAQQAGAVAAAFAALAYCLISGFAVPAQRTLYMVAVVALALVLDRMTSAMRVLALALVIVLLIDPMAVLAPGFWLSFAAVGIIFYVAPRDALDLTSQPVREAALVNVPTDAVSIESASTRRLVSKPVSSFAAMQLSASSPARSSENDSIWSTLREMLLNWGRVQWAVTIGLVPLTLVFFGQVSLVSPIANAVAIPLVSFIITPLALFGMLVPIDAVLTLAAWVTAQLMALMEWLSRADGAVWQQHAPLAWTLPLAVVGVLWMLAPRTVPARTLGVVLLAPMFLVAPAGPARGELWLTVFDVGQGLAVLARTEHHALLYDAGPQWSPQADSGSRVIIPYLRGEGLSRLDMLAVSHDDNDHAGGAASVIAAMPVAQLVSSIPARDWPASWSRGDARYRLPCLAGQTWSWDGVRFEWLHPDSSTLSDAWGAPNDRSCVLRIQSPTGSVLVAGDIEKGAENRLLDSGARLASDVLLVPHHGSTTSSTQAFVDAVAPQLAVFSVGHRNRFGHPHAQVWSRYAKAERLRTDVTGAVTLRFDADGRRVDAERDSGRRYWHGR